MEPQQRTIHELGGVTSKRTIIPETDSEDSVKFGEAESKSDESPAAKKRQLSFTYQDRDSQSTKISSIDVDEDDDLLSRTGALSISEENADSPANDRLLSFPSYKISALHSVTSSSKSENEISEIISDDISYTSTSSTNASLDGRSMSSIQSEVAEPPRRTRRKIARPSEWKRNRERLARNRGSPYQSTNGKQNPRRRILAPCTCRMHCSDRISQQQREKIFSGFWELGDINRQRELIGKLVTFKRVKRRRTKAGQSRRKYSTTYRFLVNEMYIRTCRVFFINTLGIGEKTLRKVLEKSKRSTTGALSPDNRGRHTPAHKLTDDDITGIRQHISLLPKVPAHWCRRDSSKTYLEGTLSKETTYKLYLSYALEHGLCKVSKPTYIAQLDALNIGFHQPRKDQCWCANFHTYSVEDQAARKEEYDLHMRRKEAARDQKNRDTNAALQNKKIMTASFDFEAILYSPFTSTKQLFYRRKLATFNFTVFVVQKKQGYCYMWPEHHGKKGSQEVATCLAKFIDEEVPHGVKKLNLYADNCPGQNKNSVVSAMLGDAIQAHPTLKKINLKFLEAGHTYMECDTMHATIERNSRNQVVHVPSDWAKIARHAKKSGHPYTVHQIDYHQFRNFKKLKEKIFPPKPHFTDGTKLKWRSAKCIQVRSDRLRSIFVKNEFWEPFRELVLSKPFKQRTPEQLYGELLPISGKKYKDLETLCQSLVIPRQHHSFYAMLPFDDDDNGDCFNGRGVIP